MQSSTRRRLGTIALGLVLVLGVVVLTLAVVPRQPWQPWLLGVVTVLGLSLVMVIIALVPRHRAQTGPGGEEADEGRRSGEQQVEASDTTGDAVAADSRPPIH